MSSVLACFCVVPAVAKDIKLGKGIIYSGEVNQKVPSGNGQIILSEPLGTSSTDEALIVEGKFEGTTISNVHFISKQTANATNFQFCARKATYQYDKKSKSITFTLLGVSPTNDKEGRVINYTDESMMNSDETSYSFTYSNKYTNRDWWKITDCPEHIVAKYRPQGNEPKQEIYYYKKEKGFTRPIYIALQAVEYVYDCGVKVKFDKREFISTSAFGTYSSYEKGTLMLKAKDGSIWSAKKDNRYEYVSTIHYADGREYTGTVSNFQNLSKLEEYGVPLLKVQPNTLEEIIVCDGTMKMANGETVEYEKGKRKGTFDLLPQPFPVEIRRGDLSYPEYVKLFHRTYDNLLTASKPDELQCLIDKDAAGYFHLTDISTPLQKKVFSESEKYQSIYLPRLTKESEYLMNDEYVVAADIELGMGYCPIKSLEYDMNSHRYTIELRDTKNGTINKGESSYHFLLFNYICLTYPKSLISLEIGNNYLDEKLYIQRMRTSAVPNEVAVNFENKTDCRLLFTFKFEKIKDRRIYGRTTKITLVNKKTGETCDLTESLNSGNGRFQNVKVHKDNTPKKVYHSKGKMEDCGLCLGTGKGWQGGTCIQCGGKGWYIEHYW